MRDHPDQPDNEQDDSEEKRQFIQLYEDLKNQISRSEKVIIRLMGRIGAGKSSLINSIFSSWNKEYQERETSYGGNESVTKRVKKSNLFEDRIWLADMPGFQKNFLKGIKKIIKKVIEGLFDGLVLPFDENDEFYQHQDSNSILMESEIRHKTAILLVLDSEDLKREEDGVYQDIVKELGNLGYSAVGVVTKVDKLRGSDEDPIDENNFDTDKRVADCCLKLKKRYGLNTVIPMINYSGNTNLHYKIDYTAMKILQRAIQAAKF